MSLCKTDMLSYIKLNYRQVLWAMLRTVIERSHIKPEINESLLSLIRGTVR